MEARLFPGRERRKKPRGVLPYMDYIGICGSKGYGFSAVFVINWVPILAILPPFWS